MKHIIAPNKKAPLIPNTLIYILPNMELNPRNNRRSQTIACIASTINASKYSLYQRQL